MSDKHLVCQGAMCKCQYGTVPDTLKVLSHTKEYINEPDGSKKLIATDKDIAQTFEKNTFGSCAKQNNNPCQAVVTQWKDFYKNITLSNGGKPLQESSKATCPIGGNGCITLVNHGQSSGMTQQEIDQADKELLAQLYPFGDLQHQDEPKHLL